MKKTVALALLFFSSVATLWWLEYSHFPKDVERRARASRILTGLFDARVREITRVEITKGNESTVFERRGGDRWQILKPIDTAADPTAIENLIRNLIDLPRSADVGTIQETGSAYGLDPALAIIRLSGKREDGPAKGADLQAVLEVGSTRQDVRFVRLQGEKGIEAVDAKLLASLDLPLADWREKTLLPIPTFQVAGLSLQRPEGQFELERSRRGVWTLRKPVRVPANGVKVENLLAALSSLRVADGNAGYVADAPADFGKFGLAPPALTVEVRTVDSKAAPIVLQFGKGDPATPDRVYARKADQNNVVLVDSKILADIPANPKNFRIGNVANIEPAKVAKIEIDAQAIKSKFLLNRTSRGWEQTEPKVDRVDEASIRSLIVALDNLQSSELLDAKQSDDPRMNPSLMTIKVWESSGQAAPKGSTPALASEASLAITIGRYDVLRKTVYAQLPGDDYVLAIPDLIMKVLPKNAASFRDRNVLSVNPGIIKKFVVRKDSQTFELAPASTSGPANQWKMVTPVEAKADMPTLTRIFASLSQLRAQEFVADTSGAEQDRAFGFDRPAVELHWETELPPGGSAAGSEGGRLRIGSKIPRASASYAKLDGLPITFTLDEETVANFEGELRDHRVLTFPADRVRKIALRWPNRSATFLRSDDPKSKAASWSPAPGSDASGIDPARIPAMVSQMGNLETIRFLQYGGILPVMTGLTPPRLAVEIFIEGEPLPRILRIGNVREEGMIYAAEGTGEVGAVFFLPAAAWMGMVNPAIPLATLPDDVFAPARPSSTGKP